MPLRLPPPPRALSLAATTWFLAAMLGQWAFVAFILAFFTPRTLSGDFLALNDKPHITGWVPGDTMGNTQLLMHVFVAAVVTFAGVLQLLPALRRRWPALHRWNGRVFMVTALLGTLTGFYLTFVRGSVLGPGSTISISLNGLLTLIFVGLAWRSAWTRDFASHRRHALRAWLLVNGVWFLRIGIMLAGLLLAPLGLQMSYDGAVFIAVSFLSWMLPLAVLELYLRAERSGRAGFQYAVAGLLGFLTLATLAGSAAAAAFMWWPRL
ncbi:MAG: DUF2306 domain-containing protein [Xanthomonadales bacterium]|jgi:hypothetical protein|nr:DUF2306 domain-containing protein [Xanthomonadales bacterium]